MERWVRYAAITMFAPGAALVLGAMLFGTVSWRARLNALVRGSFQQRADYTTAGWRCYWLGVMLCISAFLLVIASRFIATM